MSDSLDVLQQAFAAALAAPPPTPGGAEDDESADIATPRAKAASRLEAALGARLEWHWDLDQHQGEQLCRVMADMCKWHEHATLRDKVLDLQRRGIALLAADPTGEPSAADVGDIEDAYQGIKPREDDAAAIAAALGMTLEEAKAFGLVGTLTGVGFYDEAPVPATVGDAGQAAQPEIEEDLETLFRRDAKNRAGKDLPAALQNFWGNQQSMDRLLTVRRGFHTIKGDARMTAVSAPPEVAEELEGLAVLSEAAEDIVDYLLGDDYDPSQPAPALPPGAFSLMNEIATAIVRRLEIRRPLDNEVALLKRLAAMQRKAAAQTGVVIDEASLAAKIPLPGARAAAPAAPRQAPISATGHSLLPTFLDEAKRLMPDLHRALGILSTNPADEASLLLARRKLHTLKGGAALIGAEAADIQSIAHHAEDLFELIEDYQLRGELSDVPRDVLDGVLDAEDALQILLDNLDHVNSGGRSPVQPLPQEPAALVAHLQEITARVQAGELARAAAPVLPEVMPADAADATAEQAAAQAAEAAADAQVSAGLDPALLQRVVIPPPIPRPLARVVSLRELSFRRLIEKSDQAQARSRTAVMDRIATVEERALMASGAFSLFVGVQQMSHFMQEEARYHALAKDKGQLYVFGVLDQVPLPHVRITVIPLLEGDELLRERFAIFESPEYSTAFVAHDTADDAEGSGRRFLSLAIEDPAVLADMTDQLRTVIRHGGSLVAARRTALHNVSALKPLPRLQPPVTRRDRGLPAETTPRRSQSFGKDVSVRNALSALEDLSVTRDALQGLVARMSQQRVESRRSGVRLRTLIDRVGAELAGLRSELVRTTRRTGDWDLLEKEEFTTVDVLLGQLDEALADLEESDTNMRRDLGEATAQVESQADKALSAQRALLDISMIPLSQIEDRLAHAVRSASRRLHKQVAFALEGGDLVLDGRIADAVFEPLLHLINNALDHGIEASTADRVAAGKTLEGRLTIRGRSTGDGVAIDVIDDGRGIDPASIAAAALDQGLVRPDEIAAMSVDEKIGLIWRPGFSTAASVTAISGRGIGMKSALDDVAALNGRIEVHSVLGQGTTFSVILPRSLAMMRVDVVREGSNAIAIPITQMIATHSVPYAELSGLKRGQSVEVGGKALPIFEVALANGPAGDGEAGRATLLEVAARTGAIVVDEVQGSQYLPVRPAPQYLRRHCGLLGYAIGAGGHILPILDLPTLVDRFSALVAEAPKTVATRPTYKVLVVDDSQTMRRALRDTLGKAGFSVQEAVDGHDALNSCIRQMPDLITLDMEMPGMDGLEALTALRLLPNGGAGVPVFMITSRQQARHRAAALAAGVTRYFTKPFDSDELLSAASLVLAESTGQASEEAS